MKAHWQNELIADIKSAKRTKELVEQSLLENSTILLQIIEEHYLIRKTNDKNEKRYIPGEEVLFRIAKSDERFKDKLKISSYSIDCLTHGVNYSRLKLYNYTESRYNRLNAYKDALITIPSVSLVLFLLVYFIYKMFNC